MYKFKKARPKKAQPAKTSGRTQDFWKGVFIKVYKPETTAFTPFANVLSRGCGAQEIFRIFAFRDGIW